MVVTVTFDLLRICMPIEALSYPAENRFLPAEVSDGFNLNFGVRLARRNETRLPIPVNDRVKLIREKQTSRSPKAPPNEENFWNHGFWTACSFHQYSRSMVENWALKRKLTQRVEP